MRGRGPSPFHGAPKEFAPRKGWDPFFPPGLRHFSALAVSPSLSVALRLAGRWGPRNPIKPALGSWRSSENWQQRGIREFFNSLLAQKLSTFSVDTQNKAPKNAALNNDWTSRNYGNGEQGVWSVTC